MPRKLKDAVVVITGASSGIGRAAARSFAQEGAAVVLAARRRDALEEVAQECHAAGGQALVVATDVTDERQVQHLAQRALETYGRIDVWVNNAAVSLFARFEEAPPEAYRRVIETNLYGYIYGARAALQAFREQGSGVLINNASMVASIGQPFTSAYVISKTGIRALGECLREELVDEKHIHACTLLPGSIDTPMFQHAANYTGRSVKAMDPVIAPERVAAALVNLAKHPRRETFVGGSGRVVSIQHALMPGMSERLMARQVQRNHFRDEAAPPSAGNLFQPMAQWTSVDGGWKPARSNRNLGPLALAGLVLAAVPAALAWRRAQRQAARRRGLGFTPLAQVTDYVRRRA
ncbi:SDR family oxidoreductase [Ectothiorhodospiraceae bacterium 2226]|nr:SDR family oxidoreductase [Ectothiorhodospiraceae bacterium 2226]